MESRKSIYFKDRLQQEQTSAIRTTMIGALNSIEEFFGELWGHNSTSKTPEQIVLAEKFAELRKDILDKGNNQIRKLAQNLEKYSIDEQVYVTHFLPTLRK